MTPDQIPLARRVIACGLPVPHHAVSRDGAAMTVGLGNCVIPWRHNTGSVDYDPDTRIMWRVVATHTGPELLPVLDDFALLGWLIHELERVTGSTPEYISTEDRWFVVIDDGRTVTGLGKTRIEALVAALEVAKGAA